MDNNVREILSAAESGNINRIKECISAGGISVVDEEGSTPLIYAAANGEEKIVRLILHNSKVSVDQQNHYGWTALLQASCYGHHEVVYTLLQNKASIDLCNNWGTTPLVAAAQGGFTTVVRVLLENGANVITLDEVFSLTPLMAAAQCGNEMIVKMLLDRGANPNTRYAPIGWTALMFASLNNHAPVVKELIGRGAVREMRDVNNQRAIDLASSSGLTDVVSILSEDVTMAPSSDIDIFEAVKQENVEMLNEVIKKQKVSTTVTDKDGATPLMYAARKGNVKVCQILLDNGADFDAQDHIHRWTAFMHAVHHGHYKVAKLLAQYGANVNLRAKNGSNAFDIASLIGDTRTIQLIAEITIQRLTEKKENVPSVSFQEEPKISTESPLHSSSPSANQNDGDDEAVNILRRLSNAYLASGTSKMPSHKDFIRAGSLSPYSHRTPSPSPDPSGEEDIILPAVTKPPPSFSPLKNKLSPSPPNSNSTPPLLGVPHRQDSGKKKKQFKSSFKSPTPPNTMQPSFPQQPSPMTRKPNLRIPIATPFNDEIESNKSMGGGYGREPPQIKSPRSLPTETFNLMRKPPISATKGNQFPRSLSRYKLPPNFSSSSEKSNGKGISWLNTPPHANRPALGDLKNNNIDNKSQFSSSTKIGSFNKIKLPTAQTGLDLRTVLNNASLGHYYPLFEEEEMDINSFLTLTEKDLLELGITNEADRKQALSLILQLKPLPRSPKSPKPLPPLSPGLGPMSPRALSPRALSPRPFSPHYPLSPKLQSPLPKFHGTSNFKFH